MKYTYDISVAAGLIYECLADDSLHLKEGEEVIIKCDRYQDIGVVQTCHDSAPIDEKQADERYAESTRGRRVEGERMPRLLRRATLLDKSKAHENEVRAKSMHRSAAKRVSDHKLDMKLINTHCSFDRRLVVFQFAAEGRVDFRGLLRDLSQEFHTRVELRQVGVRDEAAIQGGIGLCGRAFCCCAFLRRFVSINVKMAKQQGLSLNPANISGACGRLKCCLEYEAGWYREMHGLESKIGSACRTPKGPGTLVECNSQLRRVRVKLNTPDATIVELDPSELEFETTR